MRQTFSIDSTETLLSSSPEEIMKRNQELIQKRDEVTTLSQSVNEMRQNISLLQEKQEESNREQYLKASRDHYVVSQEDMKEQSNMQPSLLPNTMEVYDSPYNGTRTKTRAEYIASLNDKEATRETIEEDMNDMTDALMSLRAYRTHDGSDDERYKRLVVTRLLSLLDDLRESIGTKVRDADSYEDNEAESLFHNLQELKLERERTLSLLRRKERAIVAAIALKKNRINQLHAESEANVKLSREVNDRELVQVMEKIEDERRRLRDELKRMEVANAHLSQIVHQTKLTKAPSVINKSTTLPLESALTSSLEPSKECDSLRTRIAAATAKQEALDKRISAINNEIDEDTNRYNYKIGVIEQKVLVYQDECARLEEENDNLCSKCDELAALLSRN